MTISNILYTLLIGPLQLLFEVIFSCANKITNNPGLTIISLSLSMNFLILPLYMRADALQEEEKNIELKLADGVAHIKKTFKGDERMMMLQTFYRQNDYKPTYVLRGATSLFLEIPFFIAAYHFLSTLPILDGVNFGPIADLGREDGLIQIAGLAINLLPILMTVINCISTAIFTKGYPTKTKVQLYGMALFFLVFLYNSPAGLVFYWTLNNLFSLVKTIFYKLKNPKKVLMILASLIGFVMLIPGVVLLGTTPSRKAFFVIVGIALEIPVVFSFIKKNWIRNVKVASEKSNPKLFTAAVLLLSVLTGLLVPSNVLKSSPLEFVNIASFRNPLWYVASTCLYSVGTFLIWAKVFYSLSKSSTKVYVERVISAFSIMAVVNYMFFGKELGTLLPSLQYEEMMAFTQNETIINLIIVILVFAVIIFAVIKKSSLVRSTLVIVSIACVVMAGSNIISINKTVKPVEESSKNKGEPASFTLSKNGTNVVVIMLDRAMGEYVPFLMTEKPELIQKFDGFTYYPNTISYGGHTNVGAPGIFGGYEYIPEKMNERSDILLEDKHNEALKVMPVLFDDAGYDVTICDPPYAGYEWIPDLSIYDEYPEFHTYITNGSFYNEEVGNIQIETKTRSFFCYSLMKIMPICVQGSLYEYGNYHNMSTTNMETQTVREDYLAADGINSGFADTYAVLQNLNNMTKIDDDGSNNFLMLTNDTVHNETLLQKPDYELAQHVDNSDYPEEARYADERFGDFKDRVLAVGVGDLQAQEYHSAMAAFLRLGEWFDYLRENDLYDNTRIVLVSDHGFGLYQLFDLIYIDEDTGARDLGFYFPLLMVKDFDKTGFDISNDFMTNADTPSLALEGIIENKINPFTNNEINMLEKNKGEQHIIDTEDFSTESNNGTVFTPGDWYTVYTDDVWNLDNWKITSRNSTRWMED